MPDFIRETFAALAATLGPGLGFFEAPWMVAAILAPLLVATLVPLRALAWLALGITAVALALVGARLFVSQSPGLWGVAAAGLLALVQLVQALRLARARGVRRELDTLRAELTGLHAGRERDILAGIRAAEQGRPASPTMTATGSAAEVRPLRGPGDPRSG